MFQTIAGYITFNLGRIPRSGVVITKDNMIITIIDSTHRMINKVKIERRNKRDDFANEYISSFEKTINDSVLKGRSSKDERII
jgi:Mg2+/Co2+ transporter CorC